MLVFSLRLLIHLLTASGGVFSASHRQSHVGLQHLQLLALLLLPGYTPIGVTGMSHLVNLGCWLSNIIKSHSEASPTQSTILARTADGSKPLSATCRQKTLLQRHRNRLSYHFCRLMTQARSTFTTTACTPGRPMYRSIIAVVSSVNYRSRLAPLNAKMAPEHAMTPPPVRPSPASSRLRRLDP